MKIEIDGKSVNAEVCNNVAIFKSKGWRARHFPTGMLLGGDRVFETKEQAIRFGWGLQELLKLNVNSKEAFLKENGRLTFAEYKCIADEEFERSKI